MEIERPNTNIADNRKTEVPSTPSDALEDNQELWKQRYKRDREDIVDLINTLLGRRFCDPNGVAVIEHSAIKNFSLLNDVSDRLIDKVLAEYRQNGWVIDKVKRYFSGIEYHFSKPST